MVTISSRNYALPNSVGGVNVLLYEELKQLIQSGEPVIVFDFSPKPGSHVAGLAEVPKKFAEGTFIFDPLDEDRSVSLFGDFAKEGVSNVLKLRHLLPLLNSELSEDEVRLKLTGIDEVLQDLFSNSQRPVPLHELVFAYDQNCFDRLLGEAKVDQELTQDIRKRLAGLFHLFNERSLTTKYLINPFFVRALSWTSTWNVAFMFFALNLREISLTDAKWMAEIAIMSRVHAIANRRLRPGVPRRIRISDVDNLDENLTTLIRGFYAVEDTHFVLLKEKLEDMSFRDCELIINNVSDADVYDTLNIIVIDDDIGIVDVPKTLANSFSPTYQNDVLRAINIYSQRGRSGDASAAEAPTEKQQELANAIYQLSRLKWGRRKSELAEEHLDFIENLSTKFAPFFSFAYETGRQQSDIERALAFRYLRYKSIEEIGDDYPLGNIEDIAAFVLDHEQSFS